MESLIRRRPDCRRARHHDDRIGRRICRRDAVGRARSAHRRGAGGRAAGGLGGGDRYGRTLHARDTVPERSFEDRHFYQHNRQRDADAARRSKKTRASASRHRPQGGRGPRATLVMLPERGVSAIDRAGQPFDDPAAPQALFDAIRRTAGGTEIVTVDQHINDPEFAELAAQRLIAMIASTTKTREIVRSTTRSTMKEARQWRCSRGTRFSKVAGQGRRRQADHRRRRRNGHQRQVRRGRRDRPDCDLQLGPLPHGGPRLAVRA